MAEYDIYTVTIAPRLTPDELKALKKPELLEQAVLTYHDLESMRASLVHHHERSKELSQRIAEQERELHSLRGMSSDLRRDSRVLVEHLSDAWWVKAADALRGLEATLNGPDEYRLDQDIPF